MPHPSAPTPPPSRHLKFRAADGAELRAGFDAVRKEFDLPPDFPPDVLAEAEQAAFAPRLPELDRTDVPFLTIDPPGSMDLDQAVHVQRRGGGYRVHYAIADVAAFVTPGGALDAECHRRVMTLYLPDGRTPLHPPSLCEGAASLLPGETRPAALWTIDLDASGESVAVEVRRALVRSRDRYDYARVQQLLDGGAADERLLLLAEVGMLRAERERARGGVDLPIPEQEVVESGKSFALEYRAKLPIEGWNAQISLLTGMSAAKLMLDGGIGVLRTLPPAPNGVVQKLRRVAHGLGVEWPDGTSYADVVRSLDPKQPTHAALLEELTTVLRGAGYAAFAGTAPGQPLHAALAASYAHVTAPLRRLVDRFATEACLALVAGAEVPDWVAATLPDLPGEMDEGARRASSVERACIELVEAYVLASRVGETFEAVVLEADDNHGGSVQLAEPAVRARCDGAKLPLGERVSVRLEVADPAKREVRFALAPCSP